MYNATLGGEVIWWKVGFISAVLVMVIFVALVVRGQEPQRVEKAPPQVGCDWMYKKAKELVESSEDTAFVDQAMSRAMRSAAYSQLYLACREQR